MDNSPHVPFFRPIIEELERRGYKILITARNAFQVRELADRFNLEYRLIGRHYGKNMLMKGIGLLLRALQLMPIGMIGRPNLAISHGSRSQLAVTSILRIPSLLILDYEHAQKVFPPTWVLAPELIPEDAIKFKKERILRYAGIKEDVYVPYFRPDPSIMDELGISGDDLLVTIRPPATEAHYYNPESEKLFEAVINFLGQEENIRIVLLPRNDKQKIFLNKILSQWFTDGNFIIPDHALDGLNLIWHSDLVISGGGTMNREAAALGVPVYSIFRGKIGAVDRYLAKRNRLTLIETTQDVRSKIRLVWRAKVKEANFDGTAALPQIVAIIEKLIETKC